MHLNGMSSTNQIISNISHTHTFLLSGITLSNQIKKNGDKEVIPQIVCTIWSLWKASNGVLFENYPVSIGGIVQQGIILASEFTRAMGRNSDITIEGAQHNTTTRQEQGWKPPPASYIKRNCDAGWQKESNSGSIGIIARDEANKFMEASFKQVQSVMSSLVAEALAIRGALEHLLSSVLLDVFN
ncbi:hypothetical protein LIER_32118 [Lithospermum erythrorhizon]|uniref:RNase H type-1 domain-containing protein n=1 Tax=Lithospermum erythrorhizon TaxID=34254 RepID=A0AAV3RW41_LITER